MENKNETLTCAPLKIANTSAPYVEIENGQRLMQMYGTMATQKANAELIVTAVNAYEPMLEALKKAVKDYWGYVPEENRHYFRSDYPSHWINDAEAAIALAENKK